MNSQKKKWRYRDDEGRLLAAGGLLIHDDNGIWTIGELWNGKIVYTDFGGKYNPEDGDINATISREFREETYNLYEISYKRICELAKECRKIYVYDNFRKPVYVCYAINIRDLDFTLQADEYSSARERVISHNIKAPEHIYYKPIELQYFTYEDLKDAYIQATLSFRLKKILEKFLE